MSDLEYRVTELERLVSNLLRMGTVEELDAPAGRVRVRCGEILTTWLPWFTRRAGNDRDWWAPEPGEQVMVLSPCGDLGQAVVLPAIYRDAHPAPGDRATIHRVAYADRTSISYDRARSRLTVDCVGEVIIQAATHVKVLAGAIDLN